MMEPGEAIETYAQENKQGIYNVCLEKGLNDIGSSVCVQRDSVYSATNS